MTDRAVSDRPVKAVLFDLDDTLNDRPASWRAFIDVAMHPTDGRLLTGDAAALHELILEADDGGYRPKKELMRDLRDKLPWKTPHSADDVERYWRTHFPRCIVTRPHACELLTKLRGLGIRTALVTNGRTSAQRAKIEQMNLESFIDAIVISEAIGISKPDAGIYRYALDKIGAGARHAVFVGDHPTNDIAGAAVLGMRTIWLTHGRDWPLAGMSPDWQIESLDEIPPLLRL